MRICLYTVTALPKLGGQEAVVDALACNLLQLGHHPVVLAPHPRRAQRVPDSDFPYPVLRFPRFLSTRRGVGLYRRWLLAAHRKYRFELIHCHDVYPSGYLAALARPKMNLPIVITSHVCDVRPGNARLAKPGMRPRFQLAVDGADALVSIGRFTQESLLAVGADPAKIVSIPNGVDVDSFSKPIPRPGDLPHEIQPGEYLLFLARLAKRKGIDILLEAARLLPRGDHVHLVIAGTGDEEDFARRQIDSTGLTNTVQLVGRVAGDTKTWLLQNAIATVVPSRQWEAFPLVVLESYAAGRPVIGTDIPGLRDVITPDRTGLLIPPEDPAALAAAMQQLLQNPTQADTLGRAATATATEHDWQTITQRHVALYESLIAASTKGHDHLTEQ